MNKQEKASVVLTKITKPVIQELKLAGWNYTEILNAGIVLFSQIDKDQQKFFRAAAYGLDLDSEHLENARNIFRKWILELVADAQDFALETKQLQRAKTAKSR